VRYEEHYLKDMGALNVAPPDFAPHATAFVPRMIDMISRLLVAGVAYEAEGHVLFDVAKDPDYGALSQQSLESLLAGSRVETAPYKRGKLDFVLWKPSSPEIIGWESPWGRGRPGWHIECSAMIENWFGDVKGVDTIDIHGGGQDLIFPHHENELAQSRCVHGRAPLARYWVHNGFVDMGAEMMSKSLGNVVTVEDLLAQGHKGETLRLALLSAHYRSPLPWTESLIEQSKARLDRVYRRLEDFAFTEDADIGRDHVPASVIDALGDDLNTPQALSLLSNLSDPKEIISSGRLLGLELSQRERFSRAFLGLTTDQFERIDQSVTDRTAAKAARDFATADRIRDELKAEGILLEDGPSGTTWRRA
jgi:cysteinyl-tRNA synthetase